MCGETGKCVSKKLRIVSFLRWMCSHSPILVSKSVALLILRGWLDRVYFLPAMENSQAGKHPNHLNSRHDCFVFWIETVNFFFPQKMSLSSNFERFLKKKTHKQLTVSTVLFALSHFSFPWLLWVTVTWFSHDTSWTATQFHQQKPRGEAKKWHHKTGIEGGIFPLFARNFEKISDSPHFEVQERGEKDFLRRYELYTHKFHLFLGVTSEIN